MQNVVSYGFLIPAIITVVGWFIVAKQVDKREFRKETRERIGELRAACDDVLSKSMTYWVEAQSSDRQIAAIRLKASLQRLSRQVSAIESSGIDLDASLIVSEIRKAATGGDFEVKGRKRKPQDSERIEDTASLLEDLLQQADKTFYSYFNKKRPALGGWMAGITLLGLKSDDSN